jgi:hypothetical protein
MGDTTDESDPDDELCRISIDIAEKAPIQG